jgi:hypothetical protein
MYILPCTIQIGRVCRAGFAWLSCRAGAVFVVPSSSCRGRHHLAVPSCCQHLLAVLSCHLATSCLAAACCVSPLPSLEGAARRVLRRRSVILQRYTAALYCLALVPSSSRVAAVDEKLLYCLAGPLLRARSSCATAMDESSNTSSKEVVYLVYTLS